MLVNRNRVLLVVIAVIVGCLVNVPQLKLKDPKMKVIAFAGILYLSYAFLNSQGLVEGVETLGARLMAKWYAKKKKGVSDNEFIKQLTKSQINTLRKDSWIGVPIQGPVPEFANTYCLPWPKCLIPPLPPCPPDANGLAYPVFIDDVRVCMTAGEYETYYEAQIKAAKNGSK